MPKIVPFTVVKRLPRYFRYLNEMYKNNIKKISSKELSNKLQTTASQIRQDFNNFGGFGQQGYGYNIPHLYQEVSQILGVNNGYTAIIVGVGNLGHAIANNVNFTKRGIQLLGLFDVSPDKIGTMCGNHQIINVNLIEEFCEKSCPDIAVLTLPKTEASFMYEKLKKLGVRGFWNFSNMEIREDEGKTIIENVHIGDSLMILSYLMKDMDEKENKKSQE